VSNINRTTNPTGVNISAGTGGSASIGVDRALTPSLTVGGEIGRDTGDGARVSLSATNYIFPDKNFSPFGSVNYNFGFGGTDGAYHSVGARAGAEYRFNGGMTAGAYVGFDRALGGRDASPWGAEAGIRFGIHF
jgi:hypothetical protein